MSHTKTAKTAATTDLSKLSTAELTKLLHKAHDGNSGEILNAAREMGIKGEGLRQYLIKWLQPKEVKPEPIKTIIPVKTSGNVKAKQPTKKATPAIVVDLPKIKEEETAPKTTYQPPIISRDQVIKPGTTGKGLAKKIADNKKNPPAATKPATTPAKGTAKTPRIVKLTTLEQTVLNAFIKELYAEPGFSDVSIADIAKICKISQKSCGGVISSLIVKGLIFTDELRSTDLGSGQPIHTDLVYLSESAYSLHPQWKADAKEVIKVQVDEKSNKPTTNKPTNSAPATKTTGTNKPYGKFGLHGKNVEVEGFKPGDVVEFTIKGMTVQGDFIHFHINNHSPNGYAVIKYDGKIYERVLDKIKVVATTFEQEEEEAPVATEKGNKSTKAKK